MNKNTIELRKGVTIKEGDYLRRGEEPYVILIKKIERKENRRKELKTKVDYQAFELERLTQYQIEDRFESEFKNNYGEANILSKVGFDQLWKEFEKPLSDEAEQEIINSFNRAVKASSNEVAAAHAKSYFQKVVIRQPEKISTYFELRKKVSARFRPCICMEHFEERVLKKFMAQLPDNFWKMIPKDMITKVRKVKDLSDFEPKEDDPKLKQLVAPFTGSDKFRMALLGVNFDDRGITADDELLAEAKKVEVSCEFFAITAEKDMKVEIKQTFNKGDTLLVHSDGYPFALMKPDSFKKRCAKVITKYELPKKKTTKTDDPVPFRTWLDGQIELWKNRETNRKISKVMAIKSTGEIIIEFTHYDKLLRVADLRLTYHKICLQSTKLTKAAAPARGTYRLLVSKKDLKKDYSTNRNWNDCKSWIREAYGCARDGNCSESQKELFKKFYHQCGDKIAKSEDIEYLRWLHKKTGESWKRGEESYFEAFRRVREELKEK